MAGRRFCTSRRRRIYKRDGRVCGYCGTKKGAFSIDHIVPVSRGGGFGDDNLVVACRACNHSKGDRTVAEWLALIVFCIEVVMPARKGGA